MLVLYLFGISTGIVLEHSDLWADCCFLKESVFSKFTG